MRCTLLVSLLMILILTTSTKSDSITTGNLITNGNFETGNFNNWNTTGDVRVLNDCCELNNVQSNYDLEFGDSGSINQDFDLSSDTITQNMLDNGIRLDSTIEVQNGECNVTGCWGGQGNADTFTNQLTIKDSDGNVLASNTNIRTDVTGINGANFTDRLIYNGTGSHTGNIEISGSDANAPAYLGGPNVDNISVTMTYDDTVIAPVIAQEIEDVFESVEEVFEELEFVEIEELFEELITFFEEPTLKMEMVEEFEEVTFESIPMMVEEMPEEMIQEEIVEEEIVEEFTEEEVIEEAPTKLAEAPNEREEIKEEKPNSETTKTAKVEEKSNTKQKTIQSKERTTNATSQPRLVKLEKIMDKVDKDIKDISKNLQIKNIIKLDAMVNDQVSLDIYDVPFYKSKNIYLDQVEIQDLRQLYESKTLANYIATDPIAVMNQKLNKINLKKKQILIELEQLKNG
jgi:hypothetical protein